MSTRDVNKSRRRLLTAAVAGAIYTSARPLLGSIQRDDETAPENSNVEVDLSKLKPGQLLTVTWHGNPVWIVRRTETNISDLATLDDFLKDPDSDNDEQQPEYAQNPLRSLRPDVAVLLGVCTHLGCVPDYRPDMAPEDIGSYWKGGFLCPCHGSKYDLAGRVFNGVPAPENLEVPPHRFISNTLLLLGEHSEPQA